MKEKKSYQPPVVTKYGKLKDIAVNTVGSLGNGGSTGGNGIGQG